MKWKEKMILIRSSLFPADVSSPVYRVVVPSWECESWIRNFYCHFGKHGCFTQKQHKIPIRNQAENLVNSLLHLPYKNVTTWTGNYAFYYLPTTFHCKCIFIKQDRIKVCNIIFVHYSIYEITFKIFSIYNTMQTVR